MDDRLNMVREARSAGQLYELARAEGVELTEQRAGELFEKYHPPLGELTDRELEDVSGGGCRTPMPESRFQVEEHVMERSADYGCQMKARCGSPYWVVTGKTTRGALTTYRYTIRCPKCGGANEFQEEQLFLVTD